MELSVREDTKQLALPAGMVEMQVPPMFAQFLTDQAWMAICGEMKEQQWHRTTGAHIGPAFCQRLSAAYAPMTFCYRMDEWGKWIPTGEGNGYLEQNYIFKISIHTVPENWHQSQPKPLAAKSVMVQVPPNTDQGGAFEIVHPETNERITVIPPVPMAAGSVFRYYCPAIGVPPTGSTVPPPPPPPSGSTAPPPPPPPAPQFLPMVHPSA